MEKHPAEAPHEECMDQGYKGDSYEERSNSTPMIHIPQRLAQEVHATCTIIPWGAAQMASAGQTSAHLRMKVALCLEAKSMPPT